MALVALSVVEQRLDAMRAVLAGADVTEVAAGVGVHRSTVHRWVGRYLSEQLAGLADRSHRPASCPHQSAPEVEVRVVEMRRAHPRWGSRRIRLEMLRRRVPGLVVPAERTIDRILIRHGLLRARPRKKPKSAYRRFERPAPMQLWGIDIVGGIDLVGQPGMAGFEDEAGDVFARVDLPAAGTSLVQSMALLVDTRHELRLVVERGDHHVPTLPTIRVVPVVPHHEPLDRVVLRSTSAMR